MKRFGQLRAAMLAGAIAVFGVVAPTFADSVNLDTGAPGTVGTPYDSTTGWTVARQLVGGESIANLNAAGTAYTNTTLGAPGVTSGAQVVQASDVTTNQWLKSTGGALAAATNVGGTGLNTDGSAKWVTWENGISGPFNGSAPVDSASASYSGDSQYTAYVYSDSFTLSNFTGLTSLVLAAEMSSDNYITGITLTYTPAGGGASTDLSSDLNIAPSLPDKSTEFSGFVTADINFLQGIEFTSPATFTLSIDVTNQDAFQTGPYATGVILAGTAVANYTPGQDMSLVPLPASAGVGFSLLGVFGALAVVKRRIRRAGRITAGLES